MDTAILENLGATFGVALLVAAFLARVRYLIARRGRVPCDVARSRHLFLARWHAELQARDPAVRQRAVVLAFERSLEKRRSRRLIRLALWKLPDLLPTFLALEVLQLDSNLSPWYLATLAGVCLWIYATNTFWMWVIGYRLVKPHLSTALAELERPQDPVPEPYGWMCDECGEVNKAHQAECWYCVAQQRLVA